MIKDNIEVNDPKQKADVFSKYFSTVGTILQIQLCPKPYRIHAFFIPEELIPGELSPPTTYEIELEISRINII